MIAATQRLDVIEAACPERVAAVACVLCATFNANVEPTAASAISV
jgi:hypothetical protein